MVMIPRYFYSKPSVRSINIIRKNRLLHDLRAKVSSNAVLVYSEVPNKSYIQIRGPDTVGFLNGLITSKLLPTFVKKNLTTIEVNKDLAQSDRANEEAPLFEEKKGNWGLYTAEGIHGPYISRFGLYTAFLNGKGKLVTDSVIYPSPTIIDSNTPKKFSNYPQYLLEFDKDIINRMLTSFESHKLHNKIKFEENQNIKTWDFVLSFPGLSKNDPNPWMSNIYEPLSMMKSTEDSNEFTKSFVSSLFPNTNNSILGLYIERRTDSLVEQDGTTPQFFRIITTNDVENIFDDFNSDAFPFTFEKQKVENDYFRETRLALGLINGTEDIIPDNMMPLELNFDFFPNTVNNDKGCYVGQELTARTYSTGILRKRLIPIKFAEPLTSEIRSILKQSEKLPEIDIESATEDSSTNEPQMAPSPFGNSSTSGTMRSRKKAAGTLIASQEHYGIAMIRTEHFKNLFDTDVPAQLYIKLDTEKIMIDAIRPMWYDHWKTQQ
ncbi:hypothetical protein RNJ44_01290 [Nakaseomyces bracarensis]|uniref:CAF17 C-terminal domain-containing protein n=1 Tax=Nakaseomyces bracarensis TaxID=273131 RepID=A0ABR4NRP1_9SACH